MRLVREAGCPVPEVLEASGGDLVLERLRGPTLAAELLAGAVRVEAAAEMLLGLHERLHGVEAPAWVPRSTRGIDMGGGAAGARMLHLDLHPENVVLTDRGPYLIDWTNAAAGAPAFDFAVTWAILAGADFAGFGLGPELVEAVRTGLVERFRQAAPAAARAVAVEYRAADAALEEAEIERIRGELGRG